MTSGMRLTQKDFIARAKEIHGNEYRYTRAKFTKGSDFITITCRRHGDFLQRARAHLSGKRCRQCATEEDTVRKRQLRVTLQDFVKRAKAIHGNTYDYSKVVWKGTQTNVTIVCKVHGNFSQKASNHLQGKGCKRCSCLSVNASLRPSINETLAKLKVLHPILKFPVPHNVYTKQIKFICKKHGENSMKLGSLLRGESCILCARDNQRIRQAFTKERFTKDSKKKHGDLYDYTKVEYVNMHELVKVTCKEHGDFTLRPQSHVQGVGCPYHKRRTRQVKIKRHTFSVENKAEEYALHWIFKNTTIKPSEIYDRRSGGLPIIHGKFNGLKRFLPDYYVPSRNLLIEVKTPESLGAACSFYEKSATLIKRMQNKAKAVSKEGFKFQMCVMKHKERVRLPIGWETLPVGKVRGLFK